MRHLSAHYPRCLALVLTLASPAAHAERFVYEGHLDDYGQPANGRYDLKFSAFGHPQLGATLAAPITFESVEVRQGRFRLDLDLDLPLAALDQVWLEVAVRAAGGTDFSAIPGRSPAVAAPLIGVCWSTTGDSGSDPNLNFIGSTDAQPFVVRTADAPALRIEPADISFGSPALPITANIIAGSHVNEVSPGVRGATIAGGGVPSGPSDPNFGFEAPNRITDHYGTVGGGFGNQAGDDAGTVSDRAFTTVGGGTGNRAIGSTSTVGGGLMNVANGFFSVIGGGVRNTVSDQNDTVGGGSDNIASGSGSTVSGGSNNSASGVGSTVAGGSTNIASNQSTTVGGGSGNTASGFGSTVGGGASNTASGFASAVSGGSFNCAGGTGSWAGGTRAKVRPGTGSGAPGGGCNGVEVRADPEGDLGSFVWADSQSADFVTNGPNQFLVRADGGVMFNTNTLVQPGIDDFVFAARSAASGGDADVDLRLLTRSGRSVDLFVSDGDGTLAVFSNVAAGSASRLAISGPGGAATLSNGGTWTNASSRAFKEGFSAVDPQQVLQSLVALPISTWNYSGSTEGLHMGPVAEDFKAAFGLSGDGRSIATVDADGVALAAIQGLNAKLEAENAALRAELDRRDAQYHSRLQTIEAQLQALSGER